jgi:phage terminase large subunit GpA-like protein
MYKDQIYKYNSEGEESWSLDYFSLPKNPGTQDVWNQLDQILSKTYGGKKISACAIESGNWASQVYSYCGPRVYKRIYAIKGSS